MLPHKAKLEQDTPKAKFLPGWCHKPKEVCKTPKLVSKGIIEGPRTHKISIKSY